MSVQNKKIKLPGIGARIIKSALAVSLCVLVDILRGDEGMVFYSQLAALWCIQMYRTKAWSNAFQRTTGTLVGALYGLIYLLIFPEMIKIAPRLAVESALIFVFIILVIYTTVIIHKNQASYFSCVVFLSIVINHIGDINPYRFVLNRFLDTMIGIVIGVFINNFHISMHPDKETLFVSGVDDIMLDEHDHISAFSKVELNRMIEDGMKFTVSTKRTPASALTPLSDISFYFPIIAMDGAALYDTKKNEYLKVYVISPEKANEINDFIFSHGMQPYINVIIDDTLLIYYQETDDEINRKLVEKLKISPSRNYLKRKFPGDESVVYFMILDKTEKIDAFYEELISHSYGEKFKILKYPSNDFKGYSYIKIYNKNASKESMLLYLKNNYKLDKIVTFGTIQGKYDVTIHENNFNEMVRLVRQRYESPFRTK